MMKQLRDKFVVKSVDPTDSETVFQMYRLRYQVYVEEFGYAETLRNKVRLEKDWYDKYVKGETSDAQDEASE